MLATKAPIFIAMMTLIGVLSCTGPTAGEVERAERGISRRYEAIFRISQFSNDDKCVAIADQARYEWSKVKGLGMDYVTASNRRKMADWRKYEKVLDKFEPRLEEVGCL